MKDNNLASYLYFVTLFGSVIAFLYLLGYWSTFDFNILEYISISDILRITILPILFALSLGILTSMVYHLDGRINTESTFGKILDRAENIIMYIAVAILFIDFINKWWNGRPGFWFSLGIFVALVASRFFLVHAHKALIAIFKVNSIPPIVVSIVIMLPIVSFFLGPCFGWVGRRIEKMGAKPVS